MFGVGSLELVVVVVGLGEVFWGGEEDSVVVVWGCVECLCVVFLGGGLDVCFEGFWVVCCLCGCFLVVEEWFFEDGFFVLFVLCFRKCGVVGVGGGCVSCLVFGFIFFKKLCWNLEE